MTCFENLWHAAHFCRVNMMSAGYCDLRNEAQRWYFKFARNRLMMLLQEWSLCRILECHMWILVCFLLPLFVTEFDNYGFYLICIHKTLSLLLSFHSVPLSSAYKIGPVSSTSMFSCIFFSLLSLMLFASLWYSGHISSSCDVIIHTPSPSPKTKTHSPFKFVYYLSLKVVLWKSLCHQCAVCLSA